MKLTLQVTERDKRLLVLLAIVLLLAGCWQFLLKDALTRFFILRNDVLRLEAEVEEATSYAALLEGKQGILNDLEEEVDGMLSNYFPPLPADYYIDIVVREAGADMLITAVNFTGSEQLPLSFAPAAARLPLGDLGDASRDYQALLGVESEIISEEVVSTAPLTSTEILFAFSGTQYPAFSAFLQRLEGLPQEILIRNLTATARDGSLSGTFSLVFPGIPSRDGDLSDYQTPANGGLGRADAFAY